MQDQRGVLQHTCALVFAQNSNVSCLVIARGTAAVNTGRICIRRVMLLSAGKMVVRHAVCHNSLPCHQASRAEPRSRSSWNKHLWLVFDEIVICC